ncbi:sugar-binding transcriptional regulator, partial [Rhizobium leguminosarum]
IGDQRVAADESAARALLELAEDSPPVSSPKRGEVPER